MASLPQLFLELHRVKGKEHILFTGKNALYAACYFEEVGRVPTANDLYHFRPTFREACYWGSPGSGGEVLGTKVEGGGVHAKVYITHRGSLILSSQNNGCSPLFEFAVMYREPKKGLRSFFRETIDRARKYREWWLVNKRWGGLKT